MTARRPELHLVTSNENKFREVTYILSEYGIDLQMRKIELSEIQSDDLALIASEKARYAYASLKNPVIVEDDGVFIRSLKGFPGPYSSYVFRTVGNEGVLKLLEGVADRRATFVSIIAYGDGSLTKTFAGEVQGRVSERQRGSSWGYDPIFVPDRQPEQQPRQHDLTYAELGPRKNQVSHRRLALERFAEWWHHEKKT